MVNDASDTALLQQLTAPLKACGELAKWRCGAGNLPQGGKHTVPR